jgi:hypothetical protein
MDTEGQQPDAIPEDVLLYAALCEALLDYTISLILGGDDDTRHFIEQHLVSATPLDRKRKMLRLLFEERKPDVAQTAPYTHLWSDLGRLFDYRDSIAHSQPDHGDRFNRLRRHKGENQPVVVTPDQIAEQVQLGKQCHSALDFIPIHLYGFDRRPPES